MYVYAAYTRIRIVCGHCAWFVDTVHIRVYPSPPSKVPAPHVGTALLLRSPPGRVRDITRGVRDVLHCRRDTSRSSRAPPTAQVFPKFAEGSTLQECYAAVAKVANDHLDILYSKGGNLDTDELMDLILESRTMSNALSDYPATQKSLALTTARRLAEFLGPQMVKDKGLNCTYVIAKKPESEPVTTRAIPLAIFSAEQKIKRYFLARWLKDGGAPAPALCSCRTSPLQAPAVLHRATPHHQAFAELPRRGGGGQRVGGWVKGLFQWFLGGMDPPPPFRGGGGIFLGGGCASLGAQGH